MGKNKMKVGVIIVTWNSIQHIDNCIGGLLKHESSPIYVVDNGSIDDTPEYIKTKFPEVKLFSLPLNTGFSAGNNYGIKMALNDGCDAVFLLNADTIIDRSFINPCRQILEDNRSIGIVGPVVVEADKPDMIQCAGGRINLNSLTFPYLERAKNYTPNDLFKHVDYVLGAAMLIRSSVINLIGGLDEEYFPAYVEEVDLCYRAKFKNYDSVVYYGTRVRHIGGQSSGGTQNEFRRMIKNRFLFGLKHLNYIRFFVAVQFVFFRIMCKKLTRK